MDANQVEILLVEDNRDDADLTLHALRKYNLANPILVLLDMKLPKLDGIEVLRQMKSQDATRDIPVVALTSSKEERLMLESYKLGINSYIVKTGGDGFLYESSF